MPYRVISATRLLFCALLLLPLSVSAGTVVRVATSMGEFQIELFDTAAPGTVANFLSYVNSGAYNGTVVHRLVPDFVIQGGWLTFNEAQQTFYDIAIGPTIQNEFSISNLRGTIAMAKVSGDPHSATSQWFINLGNNTELDSSNGGFTVFGRVMGAGMHTVDAIGALPPVTVINGLDTFPLINYTTGQLLSSHLVHLSMTRMGSTEGDPAVFDVSTAKLNAMVNAGELGMIRGEFALISETPNIVVKLDGASLFYLDQTVPGMATFDSSTGRLTIPELRIDGEVAYRNVRFLLTDAQHLVFTLEGAD
ncbi:MAG: peptidylprolyl isomerase [Gammaproteobacteria bacterium]|nr:peptidylprolyl isomerase [Gammaproteobacteria bacterium]MDP2140144.1 peptidylprolyl isomerase [Gammaproteobacteria bacterium]MDP2347136.1 peptidylprolyl isomerase [Gammaproteobacteria bacterium]